MSRAPKRWLAVEVRCYAGYRGEESPRRVILADREIEVEAIVERWVEPRRRGFRVRTAEGVLMLIQDLERDRWELELPRDPSSDR